VTLIEAMNEILGQCDKVWQELQKTPKPSQRHEFLTGAMVGYAKSIAILMRVETELKDVGPVHKTAK
jgi:hypothetical protein